MSLTVAIGTAGYAYPAWAGGFYPPGTPPDGWLTHYAAHFPAVEINSTFYRAPTAAQLVKMAARVPPGFRFSLKLPRSASHDADVGELPAFRDAVAPLRESGQLASLLVQFPESFRNYSAGRAWLIRVRELTQPDPLAVEFRHRSWDEPTLPEWMRRHGLTPVSVGVPDVPTLYPAGVRFAPGAACVYARLHSQDAANWYAGGAARYDYDYPEPALQNWADQLAVAADAGVREAWLFFNNCVGIQAVENAKRLAELLAGRAGIDVMRPAPVRREPTLFDEVEG